MKIIIVGDGKVGQTLTKQLSKEGHDLTVVDSNPKILNENILESMKDLEESIKEQNKEIDRFNAEKDKLFNIRISNQPKKN